MLRTAPLLPLEGLLTLHFDAGRFPPTPAACYRAPWRLPGPDSHRLATTSFRTSQITSSLAWPLSITGRTPVLVQIRSQLSAILRVLTGQFGPPGSRDRALYVADRWHAASSPR